MSIAENGDVCVEFIKTRRDAEVVTEVFRVSCDGQQVSESSSRENRVATEGHHLSDVRCIECILRYSMTRQGHTHKPRQKKYCKVTDFFNC